VSPLLNYTTEVSIPRTVEQVQKLLVKAGARQITASYDEEGLPSGIAFGVETEYGLRTFALPVNADRVHAVLKAQRVQPRYATREHAARVAWRIVKDWIEAQLAIVETETVTLDEVMLPYMHAEVGGRTVYEIYRDNQLALPAAT
jgi:hypothetical protein